MKGIIPMPAGYSVNNPPPYPVTTVNNKTGAVNLTYSDVNAAKSDHNHDNTYQKTSNIVYSTTEPAGSQGMIWFKPAE